ncbi:MAG: hypothetical protein C0600_07005, partial [Ignavibacteria bacterium]
VNEERTITWNMVPLRRDVGGTEQLKFQVHGSGGLGDRIIIGSCGVDVYVPPARRAEFICDVQTQSVAFDPASGRYIPDPFRVTATVTNTGVAAGIGLQAEIELASGLFLAPGQNPVQLLPDTLWPSQKSAPLTWEVRPIARDAGATLPVSVTFTDRLGAATSCESQVYIPRVPDPGLTLSCATELDSLTVDKNRGEYEQSTFEVRAYVGNMSGQSIYNVRVSAISMHADLTVVPPVEKPVAQRLDDGVPPFEVTWDVTAQPRRQSGCIDVLFLVSGEDEQGNPVPTRECRICIYVPEVGLPVLDCRDAVTDVTDPAGTGGDQLIAYDESIGDYEGEPSAYGDYTVFTLRVNVHNTGDALARRVRAVILPPPSLTLDENEDALKWVEPLDLQAGTGTGQVEWKIRPIAVPDDREVCICVVITAENSEPLSCCYCLTLGAAHRVVSLSMPDDIVGSYGDKLIVPVQIGETLGRDIFAYRLTVRHDPDLVRFVDATSTGTLTGRGWNGVKAEVLAEAGSAIPNLVRVEDYTTGSALSTSRTGALVFLRFEVVHNPASILAGDYVAQAPLEFLTDLTETENGRSLQSSVNSMKDDEISDIALLTQNGTVTVAGDCLLPLSSSTRLEGNKPNPFNPSTVITYELGEETDYVLQLFDPLGRMVRVIEEGHKSAGRYEVVLDMGDLPSGVYLYRLETPSAADSRRMVLSR